jgi:hypothetical protein
MNISSYNGQRWRNLYKHKSTTTKKKLTKKINKKKKEKKKRNRFSHSNVKNQAFQVNLPNLEHDYLEMDLHIKRN